MTDSKVGCSAERTADYKAERSADSMADSSADSSAERTSERTTERTSERTAEPTADCSAERTAERTSERTAERTTDSKADSMWGSGNDEYDVIIIGAGVAGCCLARELARFELSVAVLEAGNDIANGATRANSGIVHAGFDPEPGSLKAHYNVAGSRLFPIWAEELGFGYINNGAMVLAFDDADLSMLATLEQRARANQVLGVQIIGANELRHIEPNASAEAKAALLAPTSAICDPYGLALRAAENAAENSTEFHFFRQVTGIIVDNDGFFAVDTIRNDKTEDSYSAQKRYHARVVVNASGTHAAMLNNMVSAHKLQIQPVRGEYLLYDSNLGATFAHTMFQCPGAQGKGVLVAPTVHGNLILGPNAVPQDDYDNAPTTLAGMNSLLESGRKTWPLASMSGVIANFAGLRAKPVALMSAEECGQTDLSSKSVGKQGHGGDFVIGEAKDVPGFYNIASFESPGLTAALAVATDIACQVATKLGSSKKESFDPVCKQAKKKLFAHMSLEEQQAAIISDSRHGKIVCRCCNVTEADIANACNGPLPVLCLDALKWRTGATMGRCHGGFCLPELVKLVSCYTGIATDKLDKRLPGSRVVGATPAQLQARTQEPSPCPEPCPVACPDPRPAAEARTQEPSPCPADPCPDACPKAPGDDDAGINSYYDIIVVGAGAAGMAAARAVYESGVKSVLLIDRQRFFGGILRQCIHSGFGVQRMGEELTGPEYATREADVLVNMGISVLLDSTVLDLARVSPQLERVATAGQASFRLTVASASGLLRLDAGAVVLATGSRERGQGALALAGSRPSGVFTAGSAQALINLEGLVPGRQVVIQGSGDIGLIMARRCVLAGAQVLAVYARSPRPSGLRRNVAQCLDDYGIPFIGGRVVTRLEGERRLKAVWVSRVDPQTRKVLPNTEERIACDTLLLAIGLIPENELAQLAGVTLDPANNQPLLDPSCGSDIPGIFIAGNAHLIHDLADSASAEGEIAGKAAACWLRCRELSAARVASSEPPMAPALAPISLPQPPTSPTPASPAPPTSPTPASPAPPTSPTPASPAPTSTASQEFATSASNEDCNEDESWENCDLQLICLRCPKGCKLAVMLSEAGEISDVTGNGCKLGLEYAAAEVKDPSRNLSLTLAVVGSREPLSAKTSAPVPKSRIADIVASCAGIRLEMPIVAGEIVAFNVAATGVNLVATKSL